MAKTAGFGSITWANEPPSEEEQFKFLQERNLMRAIMADRAEDCAKLLAEQQGVIDVSCAMSGGSTPLHIAAAGGNVGIIEQLLAHGGDVNAVNSLNLTPLMAAAANGKLEAAKLLLAKGANNHLRTLAGENAADIANQMGFPEVASAVA